jgi:hypothetical protein
MGCVDQDAFANPPPSDTLAEFRNLSSAITSRYAWKLQLKSRHSPAGENIEIVNDAARTRTLTGRDPPGSPAARRRFRDAKIPTSRDNNRPAILTAAADLLTEMGVGGMTLQAIADAVGLDRSTMYYYFHSKATVIDALFKQFANSAAVFIRNSSGSRTGQHAGEPVCSADQPPFLAYRRAAALPGL